MGESSLAYGMGIIYLLTPSCPGPDFEIIALCLQLRITLQVSRLSKSSRPVSSSLHDAFYEISKYSITHSFG